MTLSREELTDKEFDESELIKNSENIRLRKTDTGFLRRVDFDFSEIVDNEIAKGSARFVFGAFNREMPIFEPKSNTKQDNQGNHIITNTEIQEPPFLDLD